MKSFLILIYVWIDFVSECVCSLSLLSLLLSLVLSVLFSSAHSVLVLKKHVLLEQHIL